MNRLLLPCKLRYHSTQSNKKKKKIWNGERKVLFFLSGILLWYFEQLLLYSRMGAAASFDKGITFFWRVFFARTMDDNRTMYTVWKNEKFTLTEKIFREINSLVRKLLSRNFCDMWVNFHDFHTVDWWSKLGHYFHSVEFYNAHFTKWWETQFKSNFLTFLCELSSFWNVLFVP